jgi:hypothetical protein
MSSCRLRPKGGKWGDGGLGLLRNVLKARRLSPGTWCSFAHLCRRFRGPGAWERSCKAQSAARSVLRWARHCKVQHATSDFRRPGTRPLLRHGHGRCRQQVTGFFKQPGFFLGGVGGGGGRAGVLTPRTDRQTDTRALWLPSTPPLGIRTTHTEGKCT